MRPLELGYPHRVDTRWKMPLLGHVLDNAYFSCNLKVRIRREGGGGGGCTMSTQGYRVWTQIPFSAEYSSWLHTSPSLHPAGETREEQGLGVTGDKVKKRIIFGPRKEERGEIYILRSFILCRSSDIIRAIKWTRMWWMGHITRLGNTGNVYKIWW
jgi:hypothetical protein